ncbi:hypothetical protein MW887_008625 [Aspergillus wentii]|nr:hypothetical protein MW887_008625 [Aspergillus wentii]
MTMWLLGYCSLGDPHFPARQIPAIENEIAVESHHPLVIPARHFTRRKPTANPRLFFSVTKFSLWSSERKSRAENDSKAAFVDDLEKRGGEEKLEAVATGSEHDILDDGNSDCAQREPEDRTTSKDLSKHKLCFQKQRYGKG